MAGIRALLRHGTERRPLLLPHDAFSKSGFLVSINGGHTTHIRKRSQIILSPAQPTKDFDAKWGQGFMKPDVWLEVVYKSLAGK